MIINNSSNYNNLYFCSNKLDEAKKDKDKLTTQPDLKSTTNTSCSSQLDLAQELNEAKNSCGFIAQGYDFVKSYFGYGQNSKQAQLLIEQYKAGKISQDKVKKYIDQFRYTQKDSSELVIDSIVGLTSFALFNFVKRGSYLFGFKKQSKLVNTLGTLGTIGLLILEKPMLKAIDNLGIDEKQRKSTFSKDLLTGAVDTFLGPFATVANGFVGVPLSLAINSTVRYLSNEKVQGDSKSFKDFFNQQIDSFDLKALMLLTTIIPFAFAMKNSNKAEKEIQKGFTNIANLKANGNLNGYQFNIDQNSELEDIVTTLGLKNEMSQIINNKIGSTIQTNRNNSKFTNLKEISDETIKALSDENLKEIPDEVIKALSDENLKEISDEVIKALSDKNLLYLKYLQTVNNGYFGEDKIHTTIMNNIKDNCPSTYTTENINTKLDSAFGKGKYSVSKLLGVGSVAETYLGKDENGKEIVIKIVKEGLNTQIEGHKKQLIDKLASCKEKTKKEHIEQCLSVLFDVWTKEFDLSSEMNAAQEFVKGADNFNVVKALGYKDGIYIMEKAPGCALKNLKNEIFDNHYNKKSISVQSIMNNYSAVLAEQLFRCPSGKQKIIHADPHGGNIFVDVTNIEKPLTFIDTGNMLYYDKKQAVNNSFKFLDYYIGDTDSIAKTILEGANLEGITPDQAYKSVKGYLDNLYSGKANIDLGRIHEFLPEEVNKYIKNQIKSNRLNIILSNKDANYTKAMATYMQNFKELNYGKFYDLVISEANGYFGISSCLEEKDKELFIKVINSHIERFNLYLSGCEHIKSNDLSGDTQNLINSLKGKEGFESLIDLIEKIKRFTDIEAKYKSNSDLSNEEKEYFLNLASLYDVAGSSRITQRGQGNDANDTAASDIRRLINCILEAQMQAPSIATSQLKQRIKFIKEHPEEYGQAVAHFLVREE